LLERGRGWMVVVWVVVRRRRRRRGVREGEWMGWCVGSKRRRGLVGGYACLVCLCVGLPYLLACLFSSLLSLLLPP
jgi:hypothetical protein